MKNWDRALKIAAIAFVLAGLHGAIANAAGDPITSTPCVASQGCRTCANTANHHCSPVSFEHYAVSISRPQHHTLLLTWGDFFAAQWKVPCTYAKRRAVLYVGRGVHHRVAVYACGRIYLVPLS
jgi:hypothetical protein